jgi:hypothetical protein
MGVNEMVGSLGVMQGYVGLLGRDMDLFLGGRNLASTDANSCPKTLDYSQYKQAKQRCARPQFDHS